MTMTMITSHIGTGDSIRSIKFRNLLPPFGPESYTTSSPMQISNNYNLGKTVISIVFILSQATTSLLD